jgi:hypothetical protein
LNICKKLWNQPLLYNIVKTSNFYFIEIFFNYTNEIKELAKHKHSYVLKRLIHYFSQ